MHFIRRDIDYISTRMKHQKRNRRNYSKDGSVVPIEVKSGNTRANSLNALMKNNKDICYGYKLVDGNIGESEEGIITLPLYMVAFI